MSAETKESQSLYDLSRYYENLRVEMLDFLPSKLGTMLEVGCGSASFSEVVKQTHGTETWGIEINDAMRELAEKRLDHLLIGDAMALLAELPDNYFDCVVMNDVLEHFVDPYTFLEKLKGKLSGNGVVVCSIPNVRHYTNLYNLMFQKQWRYEDAGILDRTHLRFFTENSIRDMFDSLGYEVEVLKGVTRTTHRTPKVVNALSLGWLSDSLYLQFGCRARPR